jgi:hypothetical protein
MRLMVSRGVYQCCRLLFPYRLATFTDFASGIFLVRIKSVEPGRVYANGCATSGRHCRPDIPRDIHSRED